MAARSAAGAGAGAGTTAAGMDAAAAKALLSRTEGGASVYSHLTEVILKLVTEQPAHALAAFEKISAGVKAGTFVGGAGAGASTSVGASAAAEVAAALTARLAKEAALFKAPGDEDGNAGEESQNLAEEANYLEWAGISFGRTETFRLHLALKHLAAKYPARQLRLWGKLLGADGDYVITEGVMDPEGDEEDATDALGNTIQKTGEGPNKFTYFVTTGAGDAWTRLPNVTPHQIIVARQSRRLLTGRLDAAVGGHPPFPGVELNFLRAKIAIISAATVLAPTGAFTPVDGDEDGNIQAADEWEAPDLTSIDSWVHTHLDLNALGRTKPNPPKMGDDGEPIADADAPEPSAPLKSASDDPALDEAADEGGGSWDVRGVPVSGAPAEGSTPSIVVVKSLRYPGAFTVGFQGKKYANVYVGWGLETRLTPYEPKLPPAMPAEYDFAAEGAAVTEEADVTKDPDEGKVADDGDGGDGADA